MSETMHEFESAEQFLQISNNIISTFKGRLPVSLCIYSNEMNRVEPYLKKETRLTPKKIERINNLCDEVNLFVPKKEYEILAEHLSKNLGTMLTEHHLDEEDAARIFHDGLKTCVSSFYTNPVQENIESLKTNLAIFCEYLWVDRQRSSFFFNALDRSNCIFAHAVNTLFTGSALYLSSQTHTSDKLEMNDLTLGLAIHDIGMTQLPAALKNKQGPLIYNEKMRNRMEITNETVISCVLDHHERLNGQGYPKGKKADRLSFEARICAVADAFCAMISSRSYRKPINPVLAAIVLSKSSEQYDQSIVNTLLKFIVSHNREMKQILADKKKLAQLNAMADNMCRQ